MSLLVSWKSSLWLAKLLQDFTLQLVSHSTGVFLQEVGRQVASCRLVVPNRVVEFGNGIALQSPLTGVLDFGVDVLQKRNTTME